MAWVAPPEHASQLQPALQLLKISGTPSQCVPPPVKVIPGDSISFPWRLPLDVQLVLSATVFLASETGSIRYSQNKLGAYGVRQTWLRPVCRLGHAGYEEYEDPGLGRSVTGGCSPAAGNIGAVHAPDWVHGHSAAQGRNKRKRGGRDPPQRSKSASTKQSTPNFACHFYLHDRIEHSDCLNISLKRIADVRQHLLERAHFQVVHCPVCGTTFPGRPAEARPQRDAHIRAATCEPLEPLPFFPGITEDQDRRIRDIAHTTRYNQRSPVQRWFDIWECLFPGEQHPHSPFLTNLPDIQRVADWRSVIFDNDSDLWRELPTAPWTDTMRLEEQRTGMSNFIEAFLSLSRRLFSQDASPAEDDHEAGNSSYMGVNTPAPSSAFANAGLPPASFDLNRPVVDSRREYLGHTYATGSQNSQRLRQAEPRLSGRPAPVPIQALTYPAVDVPQDTQQHAVAEEDYIYVGPLDELLNFLHREDGQGD